MADKTSVTETFLDVVNTVKQTAFSTETVEGDFFLGGDLGIDSREMLEIWYDVEKKLGIEVHDYEKRDLYTIDDVVKVLTKKASEAEAV